MAAMDKQALKLRNLRAGQSELAQRRALEYAAQKPQLLVFDNEPKPIEGAGAHEGGEKGLSRLVGRRKRSSSPKSPKKMMGAGFFDDIGMVGDLMSQSFKRMFGGAGCDSDDESKMYGSGRKMPKVKGAGGGVQQLAHARMSSGGLPGAARSGSDVPPGGVAPVAYGNPPQAPKSFARNDVMLDRASRGAPLSGSGAAGAGAGLAGGAASKRSERGRKIAMIMREKGMTLGQASAYLKKHGSE
jgi:hypothetical protein